MAGQHIFESAKQQSLFTVHGTAANQHWPCLRLLERGAKAGNNSCRGRQRYIELQVPAHLDPLNRCANVRQSSSVLFSLGEENIDGLQNSHPETTEAVISGI